jgi:hypothetical protein
MLLHRLHHDDGGEVDGQPALAHFRLVTEAPARGIALGSLSGAAPRLVASPFKLFEIVAGAQLEVRAAAGTTVRAEVEILSPTGRRFQYRASMRVPESGHARLRVPYATDGETPARTLARYRVTIGDTVHDVAVREEEVLTGAVVPIAGRSEPSSP